MLDGRAATPRATDSAAPAAARAEHGARAEALEPAADRGRPAGASVISTAPSRTQGADEEHSWPSL